MKKIFLFLFLLSSFIYASDSDLYTSAIIKLIKENKIIKSDIKKNKHNIVLLKRIKKQKTIIFQEHSDNDKKNIKKINSFIEKNK